MLCPEKECFIFFFYSIDHFKVKIEVAGEKAKLIPSALFLYFFSFLLINRRAEVNEEYFFFIAYFSVVSFSILYDIEAKIME